MEKRFPILKPPGVKHTRSGYVDLPWLVAELAYEAYAKKYGKSQSLERIAERGGFGEYELDELYPEWETLTLDLDSRDPGDGDY